MKKDYKEILESGLLEEYVAGLLSGDRKQEIEEAIKNSDEVKQEYDTLQVALEAFANSMSQRTPSGMKTRIFRALTKSKVLKLNSGRFLQVAASAAAVIFLGTTLSLAIRNGNLNEQNETIEESFAELIDQYDQQENQLTMFAASFGYLKDPNTGKFVLTGNTLAPDFQTVAYWNPVSEQSYIDIQEMPDLPNNQCFQMWVDVDGEMISLGVLADSNDDLIPLPYKDRATSLNITIEPKGGSLHPTVQKIVASRQI